MAMNSHIVWLLKGDLTPMNPLPGSGTDKVQRKFRKTWLSDIIKEIEHTFRFLKSDREMTPFQPVKHEKRLGYG